MKKHVEACSKSLKHLRDDERVGGVSCGTVGFHRTVERRAEVTCRRCIGTHLRTIPMPFDDGRFEAENDDGATVLSTWDDDSVSKLIANSSLGSPEALALRATVSPDLVARVLKMAGEAVAVMRPEPVEAPRHVVVIHPSLGDLTVAMVERVEREEPDSIIDEKRSFFGDWLQRAVRRADDAEDMPPEAPSAPRASFDDPDGDLDTFLQASPSDTAGVADAVLDTMYASLSRLQANAEAARAEEIEAQQKALEEDRDAHPDAPHPDEKVRERSRRVWRALRDGFGFEHLPWHHKEKYWYYASSARGADELEEEVAHWERRHARFEGQKRSTQQRLANNVDVEDD